MIVTIQKWSGSHGICIPKIYMDALHWKENEELVLIMEKDGLSIKKSEKRKNIKEIFAGFDGTYTPEEVDWGEATGKEIW